MECCGEEGVIRNDASLFHRAVQEDDGVTLDNRRRGGEGDALCEVTVDVVVQERSVLYQPCQQSLHTEYTSV